MQGIVIRTTGSWHTVRLDSGDEIESRLRGKLRIKGIKATNPVAVGDKVKIEKQDDHTGLITAISPRHNYIVRKSTKLSKQTHIIAANIDQALLVVTIALPRTSTGFIDRFLATADAYHIPSRIIFNKIDIYDDSCREVHEYYEDMYTGAGFKCLSVSALSGENMDALKAMTLDKINLFSGHSGVGKSALINKLQPGLNLKTGLISETHLKGKHTTTFAQMHPLDFGGYIIDTPGIKEFGIIDFEKSDLSEYFPDMLKFLHACQFNDCTHVHEPGCAVKQALKNGDIHPERYHNYLNMLEGLKENKPFWEE